MNRRSIACLLCFALVAPAPVFAQAPGRIMTVTRSVKVFSELEAKLDGAIAAHDKTDLANLLAANFEMRSGVNPGQPTPRAEWLAAPQAKSQISQMAVHDYGDLAVVSFLDTAQHAFVVDIWKKSGEGYALSVRYASNASAAPQTRPENPAK